MKLKRKVKGTDYQRKKYAPLCQEDAAYAETVIRPELMKAAELFCQYQRTKADHEGEYPMGSL
mgnify:CR=1 FL=1